MLAYKNIRGRNWMDRTRFVAILVGAAICFPLEFGMGQPWYIAVPLGLAGYLLTRFAGYLITQRKSN
jgi:hypothetical protein